MDWTLRYKDCMMVYASCWKIAQRSVVATIPFVVEVANTTYANEPDTWGAALDWCMGYFTGVKTWAHSLLTGSIRNESM